MVLQACSKRQILVAALGLALACKRETTTPATGAGELVATSAGEATGGGGAKVEPTPSEVSSVSAGGEPPPETSTATSGEPTSGEAPSGPPPVGVPAETKEAPAAGLPAPLYTKVDNTCGKDPGVGSPAQAFALKTAEGKEISLTSLRGKVVLLNFWGTWCKPCLKELPEFDRLVRHYRKHGAVLVAIATDTEPEKVLEFGASRKIAGKLVLGGEELAKKYNSPNFPFSFVVDAQGMIRGSYRSYRPECIGAIEQDLRTSLGQRKR